MAYASPDRDRARALYAALVGCGLRVFFDQEVLAFGDDWHRVIPGHLRASAVVVALVSEHTGAAHYERSELVEAIDLVRRQRRRLIPVRLAPGVDLPYGTAQLHAADMFDDRAAKEVAEQVAAVVPGHDSNKAATGRVFSARVPLVSGFFTGREHLLERLTSLLLHRGGSATVLTQTITGLGGVGKTTVAAALALRLRDDFDVIWWVRANDSTVLVADLAELAPHLEMALHEDPALTAGLVRERLETIDRKWLVVYDNAPDQRSVEAWLPRHGTGAVLVTSRSATFPLAGAVERVDAFDDNVAAVFLQRRVERDNPVAASEDLGPVLKRLGGLPLALEQAGAWVAQVPNRRFAQFVQRYDDTAQEPFPHGTRPVGYEHTAATTWQISVDAATDAAPLAGQVMAVLGFVAPDDAPCEWLRDMASDEYFNAAGPVAVTEALDALHTYSLATITAADTISIHRVIQAAARRNATPDAAATAIRTLRRQCSGNPGDPRQWPVFAALAPHVLAAAEHASTALPDRANDLWWALDDVAVYQRTRGAIADAIATATVAHDIATRHLGENHNNTLESRETLASIYQHAGDLDRAIPLLEKTLGAYERRLGNEFRRPRLIGGRVHPNHQRMLRSRNSLALAYLDAGHLDRATLLLEETLGDLKRLWGDDHPDTLAGRSNLGSAYLAAGDLDRAIPLFEATLARAQAVFGDDHPGTLNIRNKLGRAYLAAGDLDRAIPLLEATLADLERRLGNDYFDTLVCREHLASACLAAGDLDRAIPLFEATLARALAVLGDGHPHTRLVSANLERARSR